jgi:hypothetical protein
VILFLGDVDLSVDCVGFVEGWGSRVVGGRLAYYWYLCGLNRQDFRISISMTF